MTLFSEMASWWLRAAAMQMQYWQSASDKWQETVGKMTGMMPKVDPRDSAPTLFPQEIFQAPWMPAWMKGTDADTPVGAWPMPVHDTQDEPPAAPQVAVKPEAPATPNAPAKVKAAAPSGPNAAVKPTAAPDSGIPPLLDTAPAKPDDLLQLKGVGPKILKLLNDLGIYTFAQIAAWTPAQIAWIEGKLDFKGRVTRENWVDQAKTLSGQA